MIYFEQDKIFAVKKIGENGDHYDKNRVGGIPGSSPVWQPKVNEIILVRFTPLPRRRVRKV